MRGNYLDNVTFPATLQRIRKETNNETNKEMNSSAANQSVLKHTQEVYDRVSPLMALMALTAHGTAGKRSRTQMRVSIYDEG